MLFLQHFALEGTAEVDWQIGIDRYEIKLASKFVGIDAYQLVFMSADDYPNKCLCLSKGIDIDRYQCLFKSVYQYLSRGIENDRC